MPVNLRGRSLLTLLDYSSEEITYLLQLAKDLKEKKRAGIHGTLLKGKNIVLLFEKTSTRTRCAFEVAAFDEGAQVTFLTNSQVGKKESIADTACILGRYYDGIEFRGYKQETVEHLAAHAGVPVWNGLTDSYHPTQVLADLMTIQEQVEKPMHEVNLVFVGDGRNNMANSLMIGAAKLGMNLTFLSPQELMPQADRLKQMRELAQQTGAEITVTDSITDGAAGADIIYTDVWISMGEESQISRRIELLKGYQVNMDMIQASGNPRVKFMHCLPAFHNLETDVAKEVHAAYGIREMEVTHEVFTSAHSIVFDQAENRMHTIKAVMVATIGCL